MESEPKNVTSAVPKTLIALLIICAPGLHAAPIPGLFNTGVDDSGALLGTNQVDPHYLMTASPDPDFPGPNAFTLSPGYPVGPWIAEGPNSRWIAPQADQSSGNAGGLYTYKTTFDLTGLDPATARITGQLATDDSLVGVRLNGTDLTGITSAGFTTFASFSITIGSPFANGTNTLEFDVNNGGANPTGFRIEMSGIATGPNESPSVLTQPESQTVIIGDRVTFSVEAIGTPPLNYQWRFNNSPISGATTKSYVITGVATNDAGNYRVFISNAAGQTNSVEATLSVLVPFPGIYNTGVDAGRAVLLDGAVDPHYKLIVNADNPTSTDAYAQSTIPSPPWIPASNKSRWIGPYLEATASNGKYSYQLLLDLTGYDPATAFLAGSWAADDTGSLFLNGADTAFRSASFSTFATFNLTNGFVSGTNTLEFRVVNGGDNPTGLRVENLRGTAQAGTVAQLPPRVVTQPQGATRVITEEVTFTVVADGTQPLNYQWSHDDTPLTGKTNASLILSPVLAADAGSYRVRVSNALGATNSEVAQLVVIQPELGVFNTGVHTSGTALASGQPDPHYVLIASADSAYQGPTAYAPTSAPIPPWVADDNDSRWITPRADASEVVPGGYRYRLIFAIDNPAQVATAALAGNVATDDGNGGVFLNGNQVTFGASGFVGFTALDIPAGSPFVAGLNTLDFVVSNGDTGAPTNPSGLRVDDLVLSGVTITQPPLLTLARTGSDIQLAWPEGAAGFVLEETSALPGGWTNSSASVMVQGNQKVASIVPGGTMKFYRLVK